MKKLFFCLLIALFAVPGLVSAQSEEIKKLYEKYKDLDQVVYMNLNTNLFSSSMAGNDADAQELFKNIKGITILTLPQSKLKDSDLKAVRDTFKANGLEELMTIKDGKDNFKMVIREKNGNIDRFMLLAEGDDEFVVIDFHGIIPRKVWDDAQGKVDFSKFGLGQK